MNLILFTIFVILQLLDFWTTYNVIQSGKGHEGNAVIAKLIDKLGIIGGFIFAKTCAIIAMWFIKDVLLAIILINVLYVYVVYQNYKLLKKGEYA